jgi:dTDP-4-dehydrorhamnose reductase
MVTLQNMKILITGVQGQLGFEFSKVMGLTGAKIYLGARRPLEPNFFGHPIIRFDLNEPEALRTEILRLKPHIIINAAAYTAVEKAETEQELAYRVNAEAPLAMAEALQEIGGAFIHFSTDYIYNPGHSLPIREDEEKNPPNVYAASKWAGEQALAKVDIPILTLRTSWVYGVNGNNFVKTMIRLGRDREELTVVDDQFGAPTAASTLALTVYTLLMQNASDPIAALRTHQGAYNIADQGLTSRHAYALEIFRIARQMNINLKVKRVAAIPTSEYKSLAQHPLNSRFDLSKFQDTFKIYPVEWTSNLSSFLYQSYLTAP